MTTLAQQAVTEFKKTSGVTTRGNEGEERIGAAVAARMGGKQVRDKAKLDKADEWLGQNECTSAFSVFKFEDGSYAYTCTSCFHLRSGLFEE